MSFGPRRDRPVTAQASNHVQKEERVVVFFWLVLHPHVGNGIVPAQTLRHHALGNGGGGHEIGRQDNFGHKSVFGGVARDLVVLFEYFGEGSKGHDGVEFEEHEVAVEFVNGLVAEKVVLL